MDLETNLVQAKCTFSWKNDIGEKLVTLKRLLLANTTFLLLPNSPVPNTSLFWQCGIFFCVFFSLPEISIAKRGEAGQKAYHIQYHKFSPEEGVKQAYGPFLQLLFYQLSWDCCTQYNLFIILTLGISVKVAIKFPCLCRADLSFS